jgi:hypothetical protein
MWKRERFGLLAWLKTRVLSRSEARSCEHRRRPKTTRALWGEPLEPRALLSVATLGQTWKEFDFTGTGPFTGSFTGGPLPSGIRGKLAGPISVQGSVAYQDQFSGTGQGTVNGTITASVTGYGKLAEIDVQTPAGEEGEIADANTKLTIAVPGQTDASGNPMVLTGTIKPKDFSVTATSSLAFAGASGSGTWKGTVTPTSTEPFTVQVTPQWDLTPGKFGTVDVAISVGGPVQKASSRTAGAATVNLAWGYIDSVSLAPKTVKTLTDKIPIFWNQASGSYEISNLPTPSVKATHLLLVTKIGSTSQTTMLSLADLPTTAELHITDVTLQEPVRGTVNFVFNVSMTGTSLAPVTVKYQTVGDTATLGTDFTAASGTLTFTPGKATTLTVKVKVKADTLVEDDEQFFVELLEAKYAAIAAPGKGIGTIT